MKPSKMPATTLGQFKSKRPFVFAVVLFASLAVTPSCSSGDKPDPDVEEDLQVDDDAGLEGGSDNSQSKSSSKGSKNSANENEDGLTADKTPISEDGYDDDWNNLNSQQQKANNNKNNQKQVVNEEPPLENSENFAQQEQQAQEQQQFIEPQVQQFAQIPNEEPPMDIEPAPVAMNPEPMPEPEPAPVAPPPSNAPVVSGAPLIKQDVEPVYALLHWVGYDYLERDSVVRVEIVTRGSPRYNLFQERNKSDQPELVIRFFNTKLRPKVRRDIDASEFRSPVAYVRMRADDAENSVDVIITMRDGVRPRMVSKFGNILLTFPIPDHYFGNSAIGSAPVAKAEVLANANVMPELDDQSDIPEGLRIAKAFVNNPGKDALGTVPNDAGEQVDTDALPVATNEAFNSELPADFNNVPVNNNISLNTGNNFSANFDEGGEDDFANNQSQNFDQEEFDDFQGASNQEDNFNNAQGQNGQGNFNFGGGQAPAAQNGNFSDSELNGQEYEDENDNTDDDFDQDSLDNYESDPGSQEEINKFDVRLRGTAQPFAALAGFVVTQVSVNAVAQDNFEDDFDEDEQGGNQQNQGNFNQGNNAQGNNAASQNNIENAGLNQQGNGGNNFGGNNFGGNNFGGNNFGGNNATGNNFGGGNFNAAPDNAFPDNTGANFSNTTTNSMNNAPNVGNAGAATNFSTAGNMMNANEPAMDETADLAGPETEGSETEYAAAPSGGGRKVKLDFRDMPISDAVRILSDESGVNFVFGSTVGQLRITMNLTGVPFNDALKALLSSNALGMVELGPNVVKIDTLAAIAAEKTAIEQRRIAEMRSRPTKILVHRLSYAQAADVAAALGPMLLSAANGDQRISVQTNLRSNSVIVNAVPELLSVAKTLLERLDLETPQIKIAARIIEVLKVNESAFGISWGTPLNYDQGRGLGFGNLVFPNYMLSRYTVDAGGQTQRAMNMQYRFGSMNNSLALDLALSMQEAAGTTEIIQSNDVTVEDNQKAEIKAGSTDTLSFPGADGSVQRQDINYTLELEVTPHVTADGAVQMDLRISTASPGAPASERALASRNEKSLKTKLLRRSGETAVIGGVYNTDTKKTVTGVPLLSRIPIIGALFRSTQESDNKRELLIMVTPTILSAIGKSYQSSDPGPVAMNDLSIGGSGGMNNFNTQLNNNSQDYNSQSNSQNFNSQGNFNSQNNQGNSQQASNQQESNNQNANQQDFDEE